MTLQVRYCPHCGTRRTGYFRFCGRCGLDFDELRVGPISETAQPPKPEPTTPIWPPPVQWPPPDAAPTHEIVPPEQEPELPPPVRWPRPQPLTAAPTSIVQPPTARPVLAQELTPPISWAAAIAEPAPRGPVIPGRPLITWTRIAIVILAALLAANALAKALTSSTDLSGRPAPTVVLGSPLTDGSSTDSAVSLTPDPNFAPTGERQVGTVTRIIDGDTIRVTIDGTDYPVRYIGIDTPEPDTTDPALKQLADSATAANAGMVEGRQVVLERDVSDTDPYHRLLRNVWRIESGGSQVLVNLELVRLGFAKVTTFEPDHKYVDYLMTAEAAAKADHLGMWAQTSTPQSTASPADLATPNTLLSGGSTVEAACHPSYTPCLPIRDDLDCADVLAMGKAPVRVKGPDEYRLDRDKDGLGCE